MRGRLMQSERVEVYRKNVRITSQIQSNLSECADEADKRWDKFGRRMKMADESCPSKMENNIKKGIT